MGGRIIGVPVITSGLNGVPVMITPGSVLGVSVTGVYEVGVKVTGLSDVGMIMIPGEPEGLKIGNGFEKVDVTGVV